MIQQVQDRLDRGKMAEAIFAELRPDEFEEVLSIAKARSKSKKTAKDYFMLEDDLRFATNELVADWRAQRLKCDTLVEVGCGIGIQTISFAKTCKKVIAIDIDARKVAYAQANAEKRGITNVEFIAGDAIKVLPTLKHADNVFLDPGRPASEHERNFDTSFSPPLPDFITVAQKLTKNISIELPPQMKDLPAETEREYTSVDGELNRLTIYMGKLVKDEVSVTVLPARQYICGSASLQFPEKSRALKYLAEVDPAITKAGLLHKIVDKGPYSLQNQIYFDTPDIMTTMDEPTSPFYKAVYRVVTSSPSMEEIKKPLKRERVGKLVLHSAVKPEEYWALRKKFEEGLEGKRTFHVFQLGKEFILCKKMSKQESTEK